MDFVLHKMYTNVHFYFSFQILYVFLVQTLSRPIACEMNFFTSNDNLLVGILLFQINIPYGITNRNLERPVGQSP